MPRCTPLSSTISTESMLCSPLPEDMVFVNPAPPFLHGGDIHDSIKFIDAPGGGLESRHGGTSAICVTLAAFFGSNRGTIRDET